MPSAPAAGAQEQEDHDQAVDERTEDIAAQVEEVAFLGPGVMQHNQRGAVPKPAHGGDIWGDENKEKRALWRRSPSDQAREPSPQSSSLWLRHNLR